MERLRIAVVDRSPTVRETVAILLQDHDVVALTPEDFLRLPSSCDVDLVLAEHGAVDLAALADKAPQAAVVWLGMGSGESWSSVVLTGSFGATKLRKAVREFARVRQAGREIVYSGPFPPPLLPPDLVPLFLSAARTRLPVCVVGEPGTGRSRLARALHEAGGAGSFVAVPARRCAPERLLAMLRAEAGPVTLYIEDVEKLPAHAQSWLLGTSEAGCGLSSPPTSRVSARIIAATSLSPAELEERGTLQAELFYRLTTFVFRLPPLRDRRTEIPEIARFVAARICQEAHVSPARFTPAAIERLQNYLWFGNLAELETVLARTLANVTRRPIDASDLRFGSEPLSPSSPSRSATLTSPTDREVEATHQIEVLINELAHEIRNPLVTIKTISQHLERLLDSASGRAEVVQLAGEAVQKIDSLFETLLRYSRFRDPNKKPIAINAIVAQVLKDLAPLFSERRIVLNYRPPEPVFTVVDPEQIQFALQHLLEAIVRDLEERSTLTILSGPDPLTLQIEAPKPTTSVTQRLSSWIADLPSDEPAEPLGLLLARSLFRRNGGSVAVSTKGEETNIYTLRFPEELDPHDRYGQATRSHRG